MYVHVRAWTRTLIIRVLCRCIILYMCSLFFFFFLLFFSFFWMYYIMYHRVTRKEEVNCYACAQQWVWSSVTIYPRKYRIFFSFFSTIFPLKWWKNIEVKIYRKRRLIYRVTRSKKFARGKKRDKKKKKKLKKKYQRKFEQIGRWAAKVTSVSSSYRKWHSYDNV